DDLAFDAVHGCGLLGNRVTYKLHVTRRLRNFQRSTFWRMRWVWAAPVLACAYCVYALREDPVLIVAAPFVAGLVFLIALLVMSAPRGVFPSRTMIAVALAIGWSAATPIHIEWNACNEHDGQIAAVFAPLIWLTRPENVMVPYGASQTDMACFDR